MLVLNRATTSFTFWFCNFWYVGQKIDGSSRHRRLPDNLRRLLTKDVFKLVVQIRKSFKFVISKLRLHSQKLTLNFIKKFINLSDIIRFNGILSLDLFFNLNLWTNYWRFLDFWNDLFRLIFYNFRNTSLLIFGNFQ